MTSNKQRERATLMDVAEQVGVSARTVSRVVNAEGGFSPSTEAKVQAAIAELNYQPNLLARGLIRNRSDTFGFVVPTIDDPFFPELAKGVQDAGLAHGRTMFFAATNDDGDNEANVLRNMMAHSIDGAIIFPAETELNHLVAFADQGLRMVLVDDFLDHPNVCAVGSDLYDGARQAVGHLVDRGRRSIAMLASPSLQRKRRRRTGYVDAMAAYGLEPLIIESEMTLDGGRFAMERLLQSNPKADAVFAYNDLMAVGALQALRAAGRSIPEDVAIVGCDDIQLAKHVTPGLSTVRIDREQLGSTAVEQLMALAAGERPAEISLPVHLIQRASS